MSVEAVLYVCLNSKRVKVFLARDYLMEDFLLNLDEFVTSYGQPLTIHCD